MQRVAKSKHAIKLIKFITAKYKITGSTDNWEVSTDNWEVSSVYMSWIVLKRF